MAKISAVFSQLWVLWDWIVWFFSFLWNVIVSILDSIWQAFRMIFDEEFMETLNNVFDYLGIYMSWTGARIFIWLFSLAFLLLIVSFVIRFFKWQISYKLTWWKHEHLFKDD